MPCVSKEAKTDYYLTFLEASLNLKFLAAYVDYSIFKTHRKYMGSLITRSKYEHSANSVNCDIWYAYDKEIKHDSLGYYNKFIRSGEFYKRPKSVVSVCEVTSEEIELLKKIKAVFIKHQTKYKIVISPNYDQIPLEKDQLELLGQLFGEENIYNFSGKNKYSEPICNFYESSHYKPEIAYELMEIVYADAD